MCYQIRCVTRNSFGRITLFLNDKYSQELKHSLNKILTLSSYERPALLNSFSPILCNSQHMTSLILFSCQVNISSGLYINYPPMIKFILQLNRSLFIICSKLSEHNDQKRFYRMLPLHYGRCPHTGYFSFIALCFFSNKSGVRF